MIRWAPHLMIFLDILYFLMLKRVNSKIAEFVYLQFFQIYFWCWFVYNMVRSPSWEIGLRHRKSLLLFLGISFTSVHPNINILLAHRVRHGKVKITTDNSSIAFIQYILHLLHLLLSNIFITDITLIMHATNNHTFDLFWWCFMINE